MRNGVSLCARLAVSEHMGARAVNHEQVAEALFDAFANGDADAVRRLCARDVTARQNKSEPMGLDELIGFSMAVHNVVSDFRYADAICTPTASGFVEEHRVRGTLPDGSDLDLAACVVADVRDGKVIDLREYVDGVAAAGLVEALGQAGGASS